MIALALICLRIFQVDFLVFFWFLSENRLIVQVDYMSISKERNCLVQSNNTVTRRFAPKPFPQVVFPYVVSPLFSPLVVQPPHPNRFASNTISIPVLSPLHIYGFGHQLSSIFCQILVCLYMFYIV